MSLTFAPQSIHNIAATAATPMHLSFYGTPSCYPMNGATSASPSVYNNTYYAMTFPSYTNLNWTPTWQVYPGSGMSLTIPVSGIYSVKLSGQANTGITPYIAKNSVSLNTGDDSLICVVDVAGSFTVSGTAYLKTTDVLTFSMYYNSTTMTVSALFPGRTTATVTLLQRV